MGKKTMPKLIDLEIPKSWDFVRHIRAKVEDELADLPIGLRYAAGMVASELAGNAIKYGDPNGPVPAHLSCEIADKKIVIEVSNYVKSQELVQEVRSRVDQMSSAEDVEALFIKRLISFLNETAQGSQLGLYRIGYEGGFNLNSSYQNSVLTLRATRGLS
jgi:hypothetical protein